MWNGETSSVGKSSGIDANWKFDILPHILNCLSNLINFSFKASFQPQIFMWEMHCFVFLCYRNFSSYIRAHPSSFSFFVKSYVTWPLLYLFKLFKSKLWNLSKKKKSSTTFCVLSFILKNFRIHSFYTTKIFFSYLLRIRMNIFIFLTVSVHFFSKKEKMLNIFLHNSFLKKERSSRNP